MNAQPTTIFLSHSSDDDDFVRALRLKLQDRSYQVLEDSTTLRAGDNLPQEIRESIDQANHLIAVVSTQAARSHWVRRELRYAQGLAQQRKGYRVIPLLLPETDHGELLSIFGLEEADPGTGLEDLPPELIAVEVVAGAGGLDALMPKLIDALEGRVGPGYLPAETARPVSELADLVLRLRNPRFEILKGDQGVEKRRPVAEASLAFYPPAAAAPQLESDEFTLAAPLGQVESGDLRYYLERFHLTPFGVFAERAKAIESQLPEWGEDLWDALHPEQETHAAPLNAWRRLAATAQRRFTIEAPTLPRLPRRADKEQQKAHAKRLEAATELLALPWELLHDPLGYLFHDGLGVRVRRSLPGDGMAVQPPPGMNKAPLRVLIVCARPESEGVDYIDHRVSVRPLTEALNALGALAHYHILTPPTFPALRKELNAALARGEPYHIVHFDGHGLYDRVHGLGGLVFEHPDGAKEGRLRRRAPEIVTADRLGAELRHAGVSLFFLEACQSAHSEERPEASVAGKLLQSGIASVAAMSHSVLVETARRFTEVFYPALVRGERVGAAMLEGQRHLYDERHRGWAWQPAEADPGRMQRYPLELQDWFVPVLYQEREDPVLLTENPPPERVREELAKERSLALGNLPPTPEHAFVGRSRELLAAERLLLEQNKRYAVLRGEGGEGKTTLAAELARWLLGTRRLQRAAFASVENLPNPRALLWAWGGQLVPGFESRAGDSQESAEALLVQTLAERDTLLVLDNLETLLPPPAGSEAASARVFDQDILDAVLGLCHRLLEQARETRLIFTSREPLPAGSGFDAAAHRLEIGRLSIPEGMELVTQVLARTSRQGTVSAEALQAEREEEIRALVEQVNGHSRSLVLLTPELARRGLAATTEELAEIMSELEERHPGERERSLFASVELSLRRLPAELRQKLAPLAVFQGGGIVQNIAVVCGIQFASHDNLMRLAAPFVEVGLTELIPLGVPYLRFDPALAPALRRELLAGDDGGHDAEAARGRWAEAYSQLAGFLYQQKDQNTQLAAHLTLLELPNLLGALEFHAEGLEGEMLEPPEPQIVATPESVIDFATQLESLLQHLGHREALARASAVRERARRFHEQSSGGAWTKAAFLAARQQIERLLDSGRFREAVNAARSLVERAEAARDTAYPTADGDLVQAQFTLGRALKNSGDPQAALEPLATARKGFESLAKTMEHEEHRKTSARMTSRCLVEEADCLGALGRLDAAAAKYEGNIERSDKLGDRRQVAVGKFQLGTVRLQQQRYRDAVEIYQEARDTFGALGEPRQVTAVWHQIGSVHQAAGNLEEAESAYQRALAMEVQAGDKLNEAATRGQLGNLYSDMEGRKEEAVRFFRQAAEIYADPAAADPLNEGRARSNAADDLIALGRLDEAHAEITRALERKRGLGPNAEPWKSWMILHKLETAAGNPAAAADARRHAMAEYEQARRQGWQIVSGPAFQLCQTVAMIVAAKDPATPPDQLPSELRAQLPQVEAALRQQSKQAVGDPNLSASLRTLASKLLAILDGARNPALAEDPTLNYADAVELKLLLERL